jgi:peptide/nickel transport system permease protein
MVAESSTPLFRGKGVLGTTASLVLRRLLSGGIALTLLVTFVFLAIDLLPGDAAQIMLGRDATAEAVANLRTALGLDLALHVRYFDWLSQMLHGHLGQSIATGRSVADLVFPRLGNTIFLALLAAVIAVPTALALGLLTALYRNSTFDRATSMLTLCIVSFPDFFVAYTLILAFSITFSILPSVATITPNMLFSVRIYTSLLPALTLVLFVLAHMMRMTRAAIIDVLSRPYIEMAHVKGLRPLLIVLTHALPNAWAPIINVVVFNLAYLITGVVIVEVVFTYPGLGQLLVDSVSKRDIPVVQACSLIFGVTYIVLNLTADVLTILANPRLRHNR